MKVIRVATVQIAAELEHEAEMADFVSNLLEEQAHHNLKWNWRYLELGGQFLHGTQRYVNDDWEMEDV
jgi:cytochrome oxidase assembly protein ShyY1